MGGAQLASGSTPRFSQVPIFSLWSFLPWSPGKAPPTAHQQDPHPEQEGGAAGAAAWPPHASLQSIGREARPKAERRNTLMSQSQDKRKVSVDKKWCVRCLLSIRVQSLESGLPPSLPMLTDTTPCTPCVLQVRFCPPRQQ